MSDSFMSSMTFATGGFPTESIGCDCDECGVNVHIPPQILDALRAKKRQKLEQVIKRSQSRTLIKRESNGISAYQWTLPHNAEPLVEFGSSHRIVWVERLPKGGKIVSIGKGIIGSSDEEKSRTNLDWKEGEVYLVPSNGGKAVGWLYDAGSALSEGGNAHAEFKIAKIPSSILVCDEGRDKSGAVRFSDGVEELSFPAWAQCFKEKFDRFIKETEKNTKPSATTSTWLRFDSRGDEVGDIKTAFSLVESESLI